MDGFISVLMAASPSLGGFLGSFVAMYLWCPNRRCCQMKAVRGALESPRTKKE